MPWKKGCGGHLTCHASAAARPQHRQLHRHHCQLSSCGTLSLLFNMSLKLKEKQAEVFFEPLICITSAAVSPLVLQLRTISQPALMFFVSCAHLLRRTQKWRKIGKYLFQKPNILTKTSVKPLHQPHTRPQIKLENNFLSLVLFSVLHQHYTVLKSKVFQSQLVMAI